MPLRSMGGQMGDLLGVQIPTTNRHSEYTFARSELACEAVASKVEMVQTER
jgi:hypothetical protein